MQHAPSTIPAFVWKVKSPAPDKNGESVIDFTKAYNLPCISSPFATYPLPTEANYLDLAITAGEKKWGDRTILNKARDSA